MLCKHIPSLEGSNIKICSELGANGRRKHMHSKTFISCSTFPGIDRQAYENPDSYRTDFLAWIVSAVVLHEVASNCMFVAQMAFFSRVSDPAIGGTYMTLLNTIANIGGKW